MTETLKNLPIDASLYLRLRVLAEKHGVTAEELAAGVLEGHADNEEQERITRTHLEYRWQKYLETGETVPAEQIQAKLRRYAADAARRVEV